MTDYTKKFKNTAIVAAILGESLPQYLTTAVLTQRQDAACEMSDGILPEDRGVLSEL